MGKRPPDPKTLAGIACLVEALGIDLHERWRKKVEKWQAKPGKADTSHLGGMVERIRQRRHRRGLGLPVAPLLDLNECAWCRKPARNKRKRTALQWRQEYVCAHKECESHLLREPQVLVYRNPSRTSFHVL